MSKFSVKKPLTIFVAVIAILVLGVVAYLKMTPDLFPNMDFPYVVLVTTYPGASPEKVENEVTKPIEESMSTLEHIKEVTSTSAENYSMVLLQFDESVNLDTVSVDIQQNISSLSSSWDSMISTPYVLKINPSMIPVEVSAVSRDQYDTQALSDFMENTLASDLEGITGVARITTSGQLEKEIHVVMDQEKIDALNKSIQDAINRQIDQAQSELDDKKAELEKAQATLDEAKEQLSGGSSSLARQTADGEKEISQNRSKLLTARQELSDQLTQIQVGKNQLNTILSVLEPLAEGISSFQGQIDSIKKDLETLLPLKEEADDAQAIFDGFQKQIDAIKSDTSLSPLSVYYRVLKITSSAEYKAAKAALDNINNRLSVLGLDISGLTDYISERQSLISDFSSRIVAIGESLSEKITAVGDLQDSLASIRSSLGDKGLSVETIDEYIKAIKENIHTMEAGETAIKEGLAGIDSGMLQLEDASALLSENKTSGLISLANASAELTVNANSLSAGLTQIEAGYETIEENRIAALAKADLSSFLTMDTVSGILTAQNFSIPAGYIDDNDGIQYMVSVGDEMTSKDDLEHLLLFDAGIEGMDPIYLTDVCEVLITDNSSEIYARLNGADSIILSFEKQSNYATAEVSENISERFASLEDEYEGLHFVSLMDQGDYIKMIVNGILRSLGLGAIFAIIILFLFLKDIRPTFITLCSIPVSVIFAVVLMYFSGVSLNMISLSGLAVAVGMLVDNSVVVIENIYRLRSKGVSTVQAAVSGARQVAGAVTASTLTTVCVFLPIVFVEGLTRQLFTDLALTMGYALMASLLVSLTLVPAMSSGLLKSTSPKKDFLLPGLLNAYRKAITWSLKHKAIILIASSVLLVGSFLGCYLKGFIFMPTIDMPTVSLTITMPDDCSMEDAVGYADEVLARISTLNGIETSGAMMSSSGLMSLSGSSNDVTVYITLSDDKASGLAMGKKIEVLCSDMDCTVKASSSIIDMSMLTGSGISLEIYSDDTEVLTNAAQKAAEVLETVDGITNISNGLENAATAIHISVDRNKAMKEGITVAQIYLDLSDKLSDTKDVMSLSIGTGNYDIYLDKPDSAKLTLDALEDYQLTFTSTAGEEKTVSLSDFAAVEEVQSLNSISRSSQQRLITVTGELEDGYNTTLVTASAEKALAQVDLGDVTYSFTGENESIMSAFDQLIQMLLLAIVLVYLIMVAQFQSLKSPFIVMFTIPLAFTGGFLALLICNMEFSVISLIGFVMLTGIIVNNGIVLVDHINQERLAGTERITAISEAGVVRMRPILMTSITTILGLLDMALSSSSGTALMKPIAIVSIGGLVYATLMTLFVVPCLYDAMNKKDLRKVDETDLEILDI